MGLVRMMNHCKWGVCRCWNHDGVVFGYCCSSLVLLRRKWCFLIAGSSDIRWFWLGFQAGFGLVCIVFGLVVFYWILWGEGVVNGGCLVETNVKRKRGLWWLFGLLCGAVTINGETRATEEWGRFLLVVLKELLAPAVKKRRV